MGVMSVLNPYLNFRADARPALEFYHSVFGGEARGRDVPRNGDGRRAGG